jgi:hypothetical protein
MTNLADIIVAHYEKHALAWEADRRNSGWNDKIWHDRFIENLPAGARFSTSAVALRARSRPICTRMACM